MPKLFSEADVVAEVGFTLLGYELIERISSQLLHPVSRAKLSFVYEPGMFVWSNYAQTQWLELINFRSESDEHRHLRPGYRDLLLRKVAV